jgi:hypothetical protein
MSAMYFGLIFGLKKFWIPFEEHYWAHWLNPKIFIKPVLAMIF